MYDVFQDQSVPLLGGSPADPLLGSSGAGYRAFLGDQLKGSKGCRRCLLSTSERAVREGGVQRRRQKPVGPLATPLASLPVVEHQQRRWSSCSA